MHGKPYRVWQQGGAEIGAVEQLLPHLGVLQVGVTNHGLTRLRVSHVTQVAWVAIHMHV